MIHPQLILALIAALGTSPVLAADQGHSHGHGHHATGAKVSGPKLQLNEGKKWETDQPLRDGMVEIQKLMRADLDAIHHNKQTEAAYSALSSKITVEVNGIFKNCKLKPEADAMLHLVLVEVMKGADQMKSGEKLPLRHNGAVRVIKALDQYSKYFDHPGWKGI